MTDVYSVDVEITAPINDTEVEERVADAITNLFPGAEIQSHPGELRATTHTMDRFAEQLRERAILDTARRQFHEHRQGDRFTFALKKQAAFEGVVTFSVGEPAELGELHVSVRVHEPDVETFVDRIAPRTVDGVPVDADER